MAEEQAKQEQENDNSRLGDVIKVVLLGWAMAILTANYLGVFKQSLDPTYPASILSGTAASFGLAVGGNKKAKKEEPTIKEQTSTSKPK
tara:strand:- start:647 stop:913 length:267 start_codon:yes stop_codon:yes gene_type:complete